MTSLMEMLCISGNHGVLFINKFQCSVIERNIKKDFIVRIILLFNNKLRFNWWSKSCQYCQICTRYKYSSINFVWSIDQIYRNLFYEYFVSHMLVNMGNIHVYIFLNPASKDMLFSGWTRKRINFIRVKFKRCILVAKPTRE